MLRASKHAMTPVTHLTRPLALVLCLSLVAVASTACGSPQSTSGGSPTNVVLHLRDNHRTVTVKPGSTVRVVLGNTYWTFVPPSAGGVLMPVGEPVVKPNMNAGCVAGQGCGTVISTYDAKTQGVTKIAAGRISCGEALRCTGSQGTYTVTIKVTA